MAEIRRSLSKTEDVTIFEGTSKEYTETVTVLWEETYTGVLILSTFVDEVDYAIETSFHCIEDEDEAELSFEHFLECVVEEIEENLNNRDFVEV